MTQHEGFPVYTNYGFSHPVAMQYSISAALVLNRIAWSINYHIEKREKYEAEYFIDGHWWMDDTYESLSRHFRGLVSPIMVKKAILSFEKDFILVSRKMQSSNWYHKKWYRLDEEKYIAVNKLPDGIKNIPSSTDGIKNIPSRRDKKYPIIDGIKSIPSSLSNSQADSPTNSPNASPLATAGSLSPLAKPKKKPKPATYEAEDLALAKEWLVYSRTVMPSQEGWTEEGFADDIAKVRKKMAMSHEAIREVFQFIIGDNFWEDVAISPARLLSKTKKDKIRKIDWIVTQMTKNARKGLKIAKMVNSNEDPF